MLVRIFDAGADLFYVGDRAVTLSPGVSNLFDTGIKISFPAGYVAEVKNRSGMAAKKQLIVGSCIIDASYTGSVFVNLHNIGKNAQDIHPGDKIAQLVVYPIQLPTFSEISQEDYESATIDSERGEGCLGSTDNKLAAFGVDQIVSSKDWE